MSFTEKLNSLEKKKPLFLIILFIITLFFRYPTLFNDYYDVDELAAIVQTHEYLAGDIPGRDFKESKMPLYHLIFKLSYSIDKEYGWVYVHFITIFFVFLTSLFIYLLGNYIKDFKTGAAAAIIYSVFISSFNKDFLATNGEILYNLFLAAGLFFIIRSFSTSMTRKLGLILTALLMGFAAYQIKFHGIILFIYLILVYGIYLPYFKSADKKKFLFKAFTVTAVSLILIFTAAAIFSPELLTSLRNKVNYALAAERKFTFYIFLDVISTGRDYFYYGT